MRVLRSFCLIFLLGFGILSSQTSSGNQTFYRSEGLALFNQGKYKQAIKLLKSRAEQYESQRGISYYYLGESCYNLGLMSGSSSEADKYFKQAEDFFTKATAQSDIRAEYPELGNRSVYKKAWSLFRQAEIKTDISQKISEAISAFENASDVCKDSLKFQSQYMEAESRLRYADYLRTSLLLSDNSGYQKNMYRKIVSTLNKCVVIFKSVSENSSASPKLRLSAEIRMRDVYLLKGLLIAVIPVELIGGKNSVEEAKPELDKADYLSLLNSMTSDELEGYKQQLIYSSAVKNLYLYLLTGADLYQQNLNQMIDKIQLASLSTEKDFIKGVRDFSLNSDDESFFRLSQQNSSYFARAASEMPEAWYWLGWVQFVSNTGNSEQQFSNFLKKISKTSINARMSFLREDARYRSYLIRFDKNVGNKRALKKLKRDVQAFNPKNQIIKDDTELLLNLIRVSLGEPVWGGVIPQSTRKIMFDKVFNLVRQMMIRATRVTGKERVPYLKCLDKLFEITQERRKNETNFYKGMYMFLKAEIQETSAEKKKYYLEASRILDNVTGNFANEAKYIKARSIFAAAKHEPNPRNVQRTYEKAKPIFVHLIDDFHSLRSLYYLGEIFRISGNGKAAKECYDVVVAKTKGSTRAAFWYNNAEAGLKSAGESGNADVLDGIKIQEVKFPERLLVVNGEEISLERFADPGYVRSLYRSEALDLIKKFGPGKLDIYPSFNCPSRSVFASRSFPGLSAGINEKTGTISSGIKLVVILPPGVTESAEVYIEGKTIKKNVKGYYEKSPIILGSTVEIKVKNNRCYPYIFKHKFMKPGSEKMVISLLPYLSFRKAGEGTDQGINAINISDRLDNCILLKHGDIVPDANAIMLNDFRADVNLRDFCFSPVLNKFLAVNGREPDLLTYRNDSRISKEGTLKLRHGSSQKKIKSPESIAVDKKGRIYIVDWESHEVFIFSARGEYLSSFGKLGENSPGSTGKSAKFVFPVSIALSQDLDGVQFGNEKIYRNPILFIGDKYGIHMVTSTGIYWDTFDLPGVVDATGYSIAVKGYGVNMQLFLADKRTGKITRFSAFLRK